MTSMTRIRRVAMLSVHTSPLDQPGTGDAGGMNVYVLELARRLAALDVQVEVFTRATSSGLPAVVDVAPGVLVRHVPAGPYEGLPKGELPGQLCTFARELLRVEAGHDLGWYDVIHSHYWLSGQVGALASDRWALPLVHSMHTTAKVKNAALADGDQPEPWTRIIGEEQVVESADMLIANTEDEARQLVRRYAAAPDRVEVIHPGVDLEVFRPRGQPESRQRLGLVADAIVFMFAGRIQPLKGPDVLLHAVAELVRRRPVLRTRTVVPVVGGPSGSGLDRPQSLVDLAARLGIADLVRFVPPIGQHELALWYSAATLVCVPSYNESFGLVAVEAQACGTPVVAAAVGGLTTAVRHDRTGLLVAGHDPSDYATAFEELATSPGRCAQMSRAAIWHAAGFGWQRTAEKTLDVYEQVVAARLGAAFAARAG
ncbi:MAG TPA: D-inositol-3-phosphate glycosyltransferase [Nocardioidaceae bacterium]|nr:D-inositol-3-phosphate glycosyltransferase [Nocardioidaceae bacterium]